MIDYSQKLIIFNSRGNIKNLLGTNKSIKNINKNVCLISW